MRQAIAQMHAWAPCARCHTLSRPTRGPAAPGPPTSRSKFEAALGWPRVGQLVLRQLCVLLAAVAGASCGSGASELVTQALGQLGGGSQALGLQLLTALAHEAEDLDRARRLALVNVLLPRAREALGALGDLLAGAPQQLQQGAGGERAAPGQVAVRRLQGAT